MDKLTTNFAMDISKKTSFGANDGSLRHKWLPVFSMRSTITATHYKNSESLHADEGQEACI
ncbi:hypothetical protein ACSX1C_15075 [Pseudomonas sp. MBLB4123]|uniref:hypothetical protein n=1 Tax=Pseudomonas sp. MBLB4123 TaxID=3451557 RepID=UPI003F74DC22